MRTFLLTLLLCGTLQFAHSQADSLSRWAFGVDGNLVINVYCGSPCNYSNTGHLTPIGLETEYRVYRWLAFPARLDFWSLKGHGILLYNEGYSFGIYEKEFRMRAAMVSAGPRVMLRLGQGDLGLSYRNGLALQYSQQQMSNPDKPDLLVKFTPFVSAFYNLELGYSYWIQPRLALRFSVQVTRPYIYSRKLEPKSGSSDLSPFQQQLYQRVAENPLYYEFDYSAISFAVLYRL